MDKIDILIKYCKQKDEFDRTFTFIITENDVSEKDRLNFIDYIEHLVHKLNKRITQFSFTWEVAHHIMPENIYSEIIHQLIVGRL